MNLFLRKNHWEYHYRRILAASKSCENHKKYDGEYLALLNNYRKAIAGGYEYMSHKVTTSGADKKTVWRYAHLANEAKYHTRLSEAYNTYVSEISERNRIAKEKQRLPDFKVMSPSGQWVDQEGPGFIMGIDYGL